MTISPGDLVRLVDYCTFSIRLWSHVNLIGLTATSRPNYTADIVGYLKKGEAAIVIDLDEVSKHNYHDKKDVYVRLLTPTSVGWIHIDCIEKAE